MKMPREVAALPAAIRRHIATQCQGDWRRVTVDTDGSVTVHNRPQRSAAPPIPVAPRPPVTPVRAARTAVKPAKPAPVKAGHPKPVPPSPPAPPVAPTVVTVPAPVPSPPSAPPTPPPAPAPVAAPLVVAPRIERAPAPPAHTDGLDVRNAVAVYATQMQQRMSKGLPADMAYEVHANVLGLSGVDYEILEGSVRCPHRVDIASETYFKGYTVLRFCRGDVTTAVGFRNPDEPMVIAYYASASLIGGRLGGEGGSTTNGAFMGGHRSHVPRNTSELLRRLVALGATYVKSPDKSTATVFVGGQDLGAVTISRLTPAQKVADDYTRMARRVRAAISAASASTE